MLDDDPTGTQLVCDVPVLLNAFDADARRQAFSSRPKAVHVVTNSRAYKPQDVTRLITDTLHALQDVAAGEPVILRGDSTLRAHLLEEYVAVCDVLYDGRRVPLTLVPALPTAGRTTVDTVHRLTRDGTTVPLHATEYATDGVFTYTDAHLLRYAAQRTNGVFAAKDGAGLRLGELRDGGPDTVVAALTRLHAAKRPGVFAPDAETEHDLKLIAAGVAKAREVGVDTVVRAAPAYAAIATGTRADTLVPLRPANGLIVMVGSYVPTTTRQLTHLQDHVDVDLIVADVEALASANPDTEIDRLAHAIDAALDAHSLAVVATPRERPKATINLDAGEQIARHYASVLTRVTRPYDTVIAKGGITSTMTAEVGLNAAFAHVVGPVLTGVAHWQIITPNGDVNYLVVPGNVGDDTYLTRLVTGLHSGPTPIG